MCLIKVIGHACMSYKIELFNDFYIKQEKDKRQVSILKFKLY